MCGAGSKRSANKNNTPVETSIGLGAKMTSEGLLAVELSVALDVQDSLRARVKYLSFFGHSGGEPATDIEELRQFAAVQAPSVVYPYARETLAALIAKADLPHVIVPFADFSDMFDPKEINLDE